MYTLNLLSDEMAIARMPATAPLPEWVLDAPFFSVTRTPDELSILCPSHLLPAEITAERGWRCLQVAGPLDFDLVGVLASLLEPLQMVGISVFVLSTYDTDYILVKATQLTVAIDALQEAGYLVITAP